MAASRLFSQQMMQVWSAADGSVSCEPNPVSADSGRFSEMSDVLADAEDAAGAALARRIFSERPVRSRRLRFLRRGPTTQSGRVCPGREQALSGPPSSAVGRAGPG